MCGFTGFIDNNKNKKEVLKKSLNRIKHRGPDSEAMHIDDKMALGFRRLSIIDLKAGSQPMYNEDKSIVITFNGEIYNHLSLRKDLIKKGHKFSNNSDTEVLVHGYEEYGKDLLPKLRGMFAFVVWDTKKKELFVARDHFGIKPFYYTKMNDTFIFGSEIKSFLEHPDFKKELNEEALENYLSFQYSIEDTTFFKNVFKLMPGSSMTYKNGEIKIDKYFEVSFAEKEKELDILVPEINSAFEESVKTHLISDVEVGCFLSSGIDSSYVASKFGGSKTFTVGFDYHKYNEISYAEKFSEYIKIKNHSRTISSEDYWSEFSKIQYHMDEPLADPSAVGLYFVSKLASEHVKVVLSGEGADEFFGGYNIYREPFSLAMYQKIPKIIRSGISALTRPLPRMKGKDFFRRGALSVEQRYIGNANMFNYKERRSILKNKTAAKKPKDILKKYYDKIKSYNDTTKMQYIDVNTWLIGDILLKADKMSMANSIELRVPFLDKELFSLARTIPLKYKVNDENTKYALRLAANENMPDAVANKKKLGFPVPTREWLKEEKYYNTVYDAFNSEAGKKYFNTKKINKLLLDHFKCKHDNSRKVWTIYTFLVWYKEYFE